MTKVSWVYLSCTHQTNRQIQVNKETFCTETAKSILRSTCGTWTTQHWHRVEIPLWSHRSYCTVYTLPAWNPHDPYFEWRKDLASNKVDKKIPGDYGLFDSCILTSYINFVYWVTCFTSSISFGAFCNPIGYDSIGPQCTAEYSLEPGVRVPVREIEGLLKVDANLIYCWDLNIEFDFFLLWLWKTSICLNIQISTLGSIPSSNLQGHTNLSPGFGLFCKQESYRPSWNCVCVCVFFLKLFRCWFQRCCILTPICGEFD